MSEPGVSWTDEDVRVFLQTYGRAPTRLTVRQLPSWWLNIVLFIEADGERLVLRCYGVTPPKEVRWELAVLDHLQRNAFPTIAPLPRTDAADERLGRFLGKPAILYSYVEGQQGCELEWSIALAATAQTVARLHALTEGLTVPHPRVLSGTDSRRIIHKFLIEIARRPGAADEAGLRGFVEQVRQALRNFEARIAPCSESLPRGVVHHDAHCKNVLFRGDQLIALIDFDDAHEGYLVADVAVMIANWAKDGTALDLRKAAEVVRAYERHRPLTSAERQLLPDFVLLFLLCDASEYVQGCLARGADSAAAVNDCSQYKRYLYYAGDADRLAEMRRALTAAPT